MTPLILFQIFWLLVFGAVFCGLENCIRRYRRPYAVNPETFKRTVLWSAADYEITLNTKGEN